MTLLVDTLPQAGSAADALNIMRSFIAEGIREIPGGSNRTIIGEEYGWNGVAWCDITVSVVLRRIGLGPQPVDTGHFASCWFHQQAYRNGETGEWLGMPLALYLRPGDQFFMGRTGSDHTGFVESIDVMTGMVTTLEGNWADRVCRVVRHISKFYGFGRPNYDVGTYVDAPPPSATQGRAVLRKGNRGAAVGKVQEYLNTFANAGLLVDNDFGDATDTAVRAYQSSRSLTVDGEVGPQTYADMDAVVAFCAGLAASTPDKPVEAIPAFPGTTNINSRNHDAVRQVQERLAWRGWPITVDGGFGPKTKSIVEAFQREKGLTVDGVVGPQTWNALWTLPT